MYGTLFTHYVQLLKMILKYRFLIQSKIWFLKLELLAFGIKNFHHIGIFKITTT